MKKFFMKLFGGPVVHGHQTVSAWKLGVGFLVGVLILGWAVFSKAQITTWLTPGESIQVNFASDYRLRPYFSKAKIAFVPVGMVTDVEKADDGSSIVTVKLYGDARDRLGSAPAAVIRPTTMLGGNYFLDLEPGGDKGRFEGDMIPKERAKLPVELDKIIGTFQPDALQGMRGTLSKFDQTLGGGGRDALVRLFNDAPGALKPSGQVLTALQGRNPDDLTKVVDGFEVMARELAEPKGRLDAISTDLATLSTVLGRNGGNLTATLDDLPASLDSADRGLRRLNTTLDTLEDTADDVRPSVQELEKTLDRLDPVLDRAQPVVDDLRDALKDARPLVHKLVPDARELTDILHDLNPALDRVNGPIADLILNPYKGKGPYYQTATDKPIYKELGYAVAVLDRATMQNKNGSGLPFQAAVVPEFQEGLVANDGRPRSEATMNTLTDPFRINPPIQSPGEPPSPNPGLFPFLGGTPVKGEK